MGCQVGDLLVTRKPIDVKRRRQDLEREIDEAISFREPDRGGGPGPD
jgi:hypothetical protein